MDTQGVALTFSNAGLLFPAISLLMLAYTNRFLGLTGVARHLASRYRETGDPRLLRQVGSLRQRLALVRQTQALGVLSLLSCTLCLGGLFLDQQLGARLAFGSALAFMLISLGTSLLEIHLSIRAIQIELDGLSENTS